MTTTDVWFDQPQTIIYVETPTLPSQDDTIAGMSMLEALLADLWERDFLGLNEKLIVAKWLQDALADLLHQNKTVETSGDTDDN